MEPIRSWRSALLFSLSRLFEILESIIELWNVGEYEKSQMFWQREEILDLFPFDKNGVLFKGLFEWRKRVALKR